MKHLPNILTLANLFSGCIAIAFILNAQPFVNEINGQQYWVNTVPQAYYASLFIFFAAIFDLFDGMAARWLKVFSPLGKDLDSFADLVSFGVAPAMILYKMLWAAYMSDPKAMDVSMLALVPAFILPCFSALRLSIFNHSEENHQYFKGVPTPAVGLLIASFPLINLYNPFGIGFAMQNAMLIYIIIALLSWLMVSNLKLFTLKFSNFSIKKYWAQITWLVLSIIAIPLLKTLTVPFSFIIYILLSFAYKPEKS